MLGDVITVVNRTSHPLAVVRNGQRRYFQPGENPGVGWEWLYYCKNQHPLMGSEASDTVGVAEYLLVELGGKDDDSPLSEEALQGIERLDRRGLEAGEIIQGRSKRSERMERSAAPAQHFANA